MNLQALVDEITEMVCEQLGANGLSALSAPGVAPVLVVLGEGRRGLDHLGSQARAATAGGERVALVPSATSAAAELQRIVEMDRGVTVLETPPPWSTLVEHCRVLVVPNLSLNELAAISLLLTPTRASAAVQAALLEGRPVLLGSDEISFLSVHAARFPRALMETVRAYVEKVTSMGARLLEGQLIPEELVASRSPGTEPGRVSRGREVLTRDDVVTLLRSGARSIEVAVGTIVTPLAREVAQSTGVEIVTQGGSPG